MAHSVLFDKGPLGQGTLFADACDVILAQTPADVPAALDQMQAARDAGKWLAGYMSYELGYALIPDIADYMPQNRRDALLCFGVFDAPYTPDTAPDGAFTITDFTPLWSFDDYKAAFDQVHEYLKSGDFYQANLTFPMQADFTGCPRALFEHLRARQPVPHGALVDLGGPVLISRSPELFFSLDQDGTLSTRPMKGTIKRGATPAEDAALREQLASSIKNRAENLMITDLLRNDFGRIAEIGSVRVPKLYSIESYATVHQMTSLVMAQLKPEQSLQDIFSAVFPCGSITGAPKIRAMQILSQLEPFARDAYCGAIGWLAPTGAMEFNVAIRTIIHDGSGRLTLNVGGGVVYDSTAASEYDEALLKASFAQNL